MKKDEIEELLYQVQNQMNSGEDIVEYLERLEDVISGMTPLPSLLAVEIINIFLRYIKPQVVNHLKYLYSSIVQLLNTLTRILPLFQINTSILSLMGKILNYCFTLIRAPIHNSIKMASFGPFEFLFRCSDFVEQSEVPISTIIERFTYDLTLSSSKVSASIKGKILSTLGTLSRLFPNEIGDKAERLCKLFVQNMDRQQSKYEPKIAEGVIIGLSGFLYNFSHFFEDENYRRDDPLYSVNRLYSFVMSGLSTIADESFFAVLKASLSILGLHVCIFQELVLNDIIIITDTLLLCCVSKNKGVRDHGFIALEEIYNQVSLIMVRYSTNSLKKVYCRSTLLELLVRFHKILSSFDQGNYIVSAAVRSIGMLSKAIRCYTGEQEHRRFLDSLIEHGERVYSDASDDGIFINHQFPYYLTAYSRMINELSNIDSVVLGFVTRITGRLFVYYTGLTRKYRQKCCSSIMQLMVVIKSKGSCFIEFLPSAIYQGLIVTISELPLENSKYMFEDDMLKGYNEFSSLWIALLDTPVIGQWSLGVEELPIDLLEETQADIHSELVQSIIKVITSLDLSLVSKFDNVNEKTFDVSILKPNVDKDFQLFCNLVSFCKLILPEIRPDRLLKWSLLFTQTIIEKSNENPLVSGLYKLVSHIVRVLVYYHYFQHIYDYMSKADDQGLVLEGLGVSKDAALTLYKILRDYFEDVIQRITHYENELLYTCVEVLVQLPASFMGIDNLYSVYCRAFAIGKIHIETAISAMNSIENLSNVIDSKDNNPESIGRLVPLLLDFLTPLTQRNGSHRDVDHEKDNLIIRIVNFLGTLDITKGAAALGSSYRDFIQAWDDTLRVKFYFPYSNQNLELYLDTLLPRVVELSLYSSDRKLKVASSEFLHAAVLLMVGLNATNPQLRSDSIVTPFHNMFEHIFPALLQLATDVDTVCKSLFRNLVLQLIRWYSQVINREKEETLVLVKCIMDALGNSSEAALRTFSSECIAEFFKWSIKQSISSVSKPIVTTDILLRHLHSYLLHPNAYKRIGACTALNYVYRLFRENDRVISIHILNLMKHVVLCLGLSNNDTEALRATSQTEASSVLGNFLRILSDKDRNKVELIKLTDEFRIGSPDCISLDAFLNWCFSQISILPNVARRACMKLLETLTPVSVYHTIHGYMLHHYSDRNILVNQLGHNERLECNTLDDSRDFIKWLDYLESFMDSYVWMVSICKFSIGFEYVPLLNQALVLYFKFIYNGDCVNTENNNMLRSVSKQVVRYLYSLDSSDMDRLRDMIGMEMYLIILEMLLDPTVVGYHHSLPTSVLKFQLQVSTLLKKLNDNSIDLKSCLKSLLDDRKDLSVWSMDLNVFSSHPEQPPLILHAYSELWRIGIMDLNWNVVPEGYGHVLVSFVVERVRSAERLLPIQERNLSYLVKFGLLIGIDQQTFISLLSLDNMMFVKDFKHILIGYINNNSRLFYLSIFSRVYDQSTTEKEYKVCLDVLLGCIRDTHDIDYCIQVFMVVFSKYYIKLSSLDDVSKGIAILTLLELLLSRIEHQHQEFFALSESIVTFYLRNSSISCFILKKKSIELLYSLISYKKGKMSFESKESLKLLLGAPPFAANSRDVPNGSIDWDRYVTCLSLLLICLKRTLCYDLLEEMLVILREENHSYRKFINKHIDNLVKELANPYKASNESYVFISRCLNYFMNFELDTNIYDNSRVWIINHICVPFLYRCPRSGCHKVFDEYSKEVWKIVCQNESPCVPNPSLPALLQINTFQNMTCSYRLLSCFVKRLPKGIIGNIEPSKRALVMIPNTHLKRVSLNKEFPSANRVNHEFHSAAFEMLTCYIIKTQVKESLFIAPISCKPGEKLWSHIVDLQEMFMLQIDTNFPKDKGIRAVSEADEQDHQTVYMTTQYLEASSLSSDIPYLQSFLGIGSISKDSLRGDFDEEHEYEDEGDGDVYKAEEMELELDYFNRNPSMRSILSLLDRAHALFRDSWEVDPLKGFIKAILDTFNQYDCNVKVKLFILKVILNRPELFRGYSKHWFCSIIDLLISPNSSEPPWVGFHYILRDVCGLFIRWKYIPIDSPQWEYASVFMEHLIGIAHDYGQLQLPSEARTSKMQFEGKVNKLKHNIHCIQQLIYMWKDKLVVKKDGIIKHLTNQEYRHEIKVRKITGLQILGALLANGIAEYDVCVDLHISLDSYSGLLLSCMQSTIKEVYESCSEVFGMIYKVYCDAGVDNPSSLGSSVYKQVIREYIYKLYNNGEYSRMLNCLNKIGMYDKTFLNDQIMKRVLPIISGLPGEIQSWGLQLILWKSNDIFDLVDHLKPLVSENSDMLRSIHSQRLYMIIFITIADRLKENQGSFVKCVFNRFRKHRDETCRVSAYKGLITLLGKNPNIVQESSLYQDLWKMLVQGLSDPSIVVGDLLLEYFNEHIETSSRMEFCINELYHIDTESSWLSYVMYLLIQPSKSSAGYSEPLTLFPLGECAFEDMDIDSAYHSSKAFLTTPLFSQEEKTEMTGRILATQEPQFSLTQSIATMEPSEMLNFVMNDKNASMQFGHEKSDDMLGSLAGLEDLSKPRKEKSARFGKSSSRIARNLSINKKDLETRYQEKVKRRVEEELRNTVSIYRQYRIGELPDIQIPKCDLILSLQALHKDPVISRQLFLVFFKAKYELSSDQERRILEQGLVGLLSKVSKSPSLASCIMLALSQCEGAYLTIEASVIAHIAIDTKSYHSGIVLLEKLMTDYLVLEPSVEQQKLKRRDIDASARMKSEKCVGLELAKVYQALGENDIVLGLYDEFVEDSRSKSGILELLQMHYHQALGIYDEALEQYESSNNQEAFQRFEIDLWNDGRRHCLNCLGRYDVLIKEMESIDIWDSKHYSSIDYQKKDLKCLLWCYSRSPKHYHKLESFLFEAFQDPIKKNYLEDEFFEELFQAFALCNDRSRSEFYLEKGIDKFLKKWTELPTLAFTARNRMLVSLQIYSEVKEYLDVFRRDEVNTDQLENLLHSWRYRPLCNPRALDVYAEVLFNRTSFLCNTLQVLNREDTQVFQDSIVQLCVDSLKSVTALYIDIENTEMASRCITKASKLIRKHSIPDDVELVMLDFRVKSSVHYNLNLDDILVLIDRFNKALDRYPSISLEQKIDAMILSGSVLYSSSDERAAYMAIDMLKKSYIWIDKQGNLGPLSTNLSELTLRLGLLCHALIPNADDEFVDSIVNLGYRKESIEFILESVRLGNYKSMDYIPQCLNDISGYSGLYSVFEELCQSIPTWIFLQWIPQLLGYLSSSERSCVSKVLIRIGEAYPQALYYPFSICTEYLENYKEAHHIIQEIKELVRNPDIENLIEGLEYLEFPSNLFKEWKKIVTSAVMKGDVELARLECNRLYNGIFIRSETIFRSFKGMKRVFEGLFGSPANGLNIKFKHIIQNRELGRFNEFVMNMKVPSDSNVHGRLYLEDLSLFLHSYRPENVEIPGQYTGLHQPDPELHTRLISISNVVLVMKSLRRPKRISIIGNDEREYYWLIKSGEDLRLDQRVQQMFVTMNRIQLHDKLCKERSLEITTYKVVPLSGRVGMIEWVNNTTPVKPLIEHQLNQRSNINSIVELYSSWIFKKAQKHRGSTLTILDAYYQLFTKVPRKDVVAKFKYLENILPADCLTKAVLAFCSNEEAFISVRYRFCKSLAVLSICSYILGIGDRHLDNFLIDKSDGSIIGIDYGMAFGQAITLPIPELVPFRLTRQFTSFLKPLDSIALLKHNMIHCLQALRRQRDYLLMIMQVFVKEPHLDWQNQALLELNELYGEHLDINVMSSNEWYKKKIKIVDRKLKGFSSSSIMLDELDGSVHGLNEYGDALRGIILGGHATIRSNIPSDRQLDVTQQIDCLIDHATDPNILGRSWQNWAPFV